MVLISKVFHSTDLLGSKIITLELLDAFLLILHPENPLTIEIKGDKNLGNFKLPMGPDFAVSDINFI